MTMHVKTLQAAKSGSCMPFVKPTAAVRMEG